MIYEYLLKMNRILIEQKLNDIKIAKLLMSKMPKISIKYLMKDFNYNEEKSINLINTFMEIMKEYNGYLILDHPKINNLGSLRYVGSLSIGNDCNIQTLGNLQEIGDDIIINSEKVKSFGDLTHVGKTMILSNVSIRNFGKLKMINGNLVIHNSIIGSISEKKIRDNITVGGEITIDLTDENMEYYLEKPIII